MLLVSLCKHFLQFWLKKKKKVIGSHADFLFHVFEVFILSFGKFIAQAQPIDLYTKFSFKYFSFIMENIAGLLTNNNITIEIMNHPLEICLCQWNVISLWANG